MHVTVPAMAAQPLMHGTSTNLSGTPGAGSAQCWGSAYLLGQGGLGHLPAPSSQLLDQERCARGTGIPITSQPTGHLVWVLPGESPPHGTAGAGGTGAPWTCPTFLEKHFLHFLDFQGFLLKPVRNRRGLFLRRNLQGHPRLQKNPSPQGHAQGRELGTWSKLSRPGGRNRSTSP